eukprot:PhM_4_TR249/c0_g1_i1/m.104855
MWFQSSFKQLSGVQMRQVGSVVGAAIADAALAHTSVAAAGPSQLSVTRVPFAGRTLQERKAAKLPLQSVYCQEMMSTLRCIEGERGVLLYDSLHAELVSSVKLPGAKHTPALLDFVHAVTEGELREDTVADAPPYADVDALSSCIPVVALYPWSSDKDLAASIEHIWQLFDVRQMRSGGYPYYTAATRVLLRYLLRSTAPLTNTYLQMDEGPARDLLKFVADNPTTEHDEANRSTVEPTVQSVVARALPVVLDATSFENGVELFLRRHDGDLTPAAPYLGACLGAKFGSRGLPLEWFAAMEGHELVGTLALSMAQHAWNPDLKGAGLMEQVDPTGEF